MRYYQGESLSSGIAIFSPSFLSSLAEQALHIAFICYFIHLNIFFLEYFLKQLYVILPLVLRNVIKELIGVPATKFLLFNCICFPVLQVFPNNFQIKQSSKFLLFRRALFFWVKQLFTEKKSKQTSNPTRYTTPNHKIQFLRNMFKIHKEKCHFLQAFMIFFSPK